MSDHLRAKAASYPTFGGFNMTHPPSTKTHGILADGVFVPPVMIPALAVLSIMLWVAYKLVAN